MPSNLSPSREAVQAVSDFMASEDVDCPWIPMDDEILLMLRAAYAVDCAPLMDALRPFAVSVPAYCDDRDILKPFITAGDLRRVAAVLARSQEPHKETQ